MTAWITSLTSGAAGAVALTLIHEAARRRLPHAPRMDLVGMRALRRLVPSLRGAPDEEVHRLTLLGDLAANSLYYAAIAGPTPAATWRRAAALGVAAGAGALFLPEPMGLGSPPHRHTRGNAIMTMGWYVAGAATAAAVATAINRRR